MIYGIRNMVEIDNPYRTVYEAEVRFENENSVETYFIRGNGLDWYFDSEKNYTAVPKDLALRLHQYLEGRTFWGNSPEIMAEGF